MLQDVIRTMYNPKFIAELFRGQDVYNMQSTRQIFDKLAHSSIMRLNESSMDKARSPTCPHSRRLLLQTPVAATSGGGGALPHASRTSHALSLLPRNLLPRNLLARCAPPHLASRYTSFSVAAL